MSNITYKLFPAKMGGREASTFIGKKGEIFYDPTNTLLRISDGVTPGGISISTDRAQGCFHKLAQVTAADSDTLYAFDRYTDTTAHLSDDVTVTSSVK